MYCVALCDCCTCLDGCDTHDGTCPVSINSPICCHCWTPDRSHRHWFEGYPENDIAKKEYIKDLLENCEEYCIVHLPLIPDLANYIDSFHSFVTFRAQAHKQ